MFNWLGKLFRAQSAAEAHRRNPAVQRIVQESSEIYTRTPLNRLIDKACADRLAREYFLEINGICNAYEPKTAVREKIATEMLRFALYQVLVMPAKTGDGFNEIRGLAGISGELGEHITKLVPINMALRADVHASDLFNDGADLDRLVEIEYWKNYWLLESINAARRQLGDVTEPDDWYRPFMHAACANQENLYRIDLDLPSAFDEEFSRTAPTAYSIFTDIVVAGAADPLAEWRDYHAGQNIPEPGKSPTTRS